MEREAMGGVRKGVGKGRRNDPNIVCKYEFKKKKESSLKKLNT
jgi:hypothetical protein